MKTTLLRHSPWRAVLVAALLSTACASTPPPDAQLAVSRSAIDDALAAGAADAAPLDLQKARDKLSLANASVAVEKHEDARRFAEAAEVDARLAAARARTAHANLAAAEIQQSIRALRENLSFDSGGTPPNPRGTP